MPAAAALTSIRSLVEGLAALDQAEQCLLDLPQDDERLLGGRGDGRLGGGDGGFEQLGHGVGENLLRVVDAEGAVAGADMAVLNPVSTACRA